MSDNATSGLRINALREALAAISRYAHTVLWLSESTLESIWQKAETALIEDANMRMDAERAEASDE